MENMILTTFELFNYFEIINDDVDEEMTNNNIKNAETFQVFLSLILSIRLLHNFKNLLLVINKK